MTYFPHPLPERPAMHAAAQPGDVRQTLPRDILWNQPVFKAPALPIPKIALEPFAPAPLDWGQTPGSDRRSNGATLRATRITRRPSAPA